MQTLEQSLSTCIEERIRKGNYPIPMLPKTALLLMDLLAKPNSTIEEIEKVVTLDPLIAGQILRMANSSIYGGIVEITSLRMAISRLGRRQIRSVIYTISLHSTLLKGDKVSKPSQDVWEHSLASAFLTRKFSRWVEEGEEDLFLGGLLHEVGKMLLLSLVQDIVNQHESSFPGEEELGALFGKFHISLGVKLAQSWSLPEKITEVIAYHDDFSHAPHYPHLVACASLAGKLCERPNHLQAALEELTALPESEFLQLSVEALEESIAAVPKIYKDVKTLL